MPAGASGGGIRRKRRRGGGEDLYGVEPLAETGYKVDTSRLDDIKIFTSTSLDTIRSNITVTLDGEQISPDGYYLTVDGGTLHSGTNSINVYIHGSDETPIYTFQLNALTVEIEEMTAKLAQGFEIYSSYSEDTSIIKDNLEVEVKFNDGTTAILNDDEYDINGQFSPGQLNTFTVTYRADTSKTCTFEANVLEQAFKSLRVEFDQDNPVPSSTSVADLKEMTYEDYAYGNVGLIEVFGVFADGHEEPLSFSQYDFEGSLKTDVEGVTESDHGTYWVKISVVDATGMVKTDLTVDVSRSTPTGISYNGDGSLRFSVGDTYTPGESDFRINFNDGSRFALPNELTLSYPEEMVDEDGRFIKADRFTLTVSYSEGGQPVTASVNIIVTQAEVERPTFDMTPGTYDGGEQIKRIITGFDPGIMKLTVHRDGALLGDSDYHLDTGPDGNLYFCATEAGSYTIEVTLDENYQWTTGTNPSWTWTVNPASIDAVLEIGGWTYEEVPTDHPFKVYERGNEDLVYSNVTVWYYNGTTISRADATQTQPTTAGIWYAYAEVSASGNYKSDTTDDIDFEILKKQVPKPVIDDIEYDTEVHDVSQDADADHHYTIKADPQTDVGNYSATVTMTNAYFANHKWEGTESQSTTIPWKIIKATVEIPTISGTWTYSVTDGVPDEKSFTFDSKYQDIISLSCTDGDVTVGGLTISSNQAGVYAINVGFTEAAAKNYRWEGDGDDTSIKTPIWTIGKAGVDKPTQKAVMPVYDGDTIWYTEAIDVRNADLVVITGQTSGMDVDNYTVEIALEDPNNYKWSGTDDDSKEFSIDWSIEKATNSVTDVLVTPPEGGLEYNDFGLEVFSATPRFGEVEYRFSKEIDGVYTSQVIPLDAGKWYVKAFVQGNSNYSDAESEPTEFTIAKAKNTITLDEYTETYTYGDVIPNPKFKATWDDGTITFQYSDQKDGAFTTADSLPRDANESWYIRAYYPGSLNYEEGYSENVITLRIDRLPIPYPELSYSEEHGTVSDDGKSYVYNGGEQIPVTSHDFDYPFDDVMGDAFSSDLEKKVDAGTYPVTFTPGSNYEWSDPDSEDPTSSYSELSWTISKQKITIKSFDREMVYDGGQVFAPEIEPVNPDHKGLYDQSAMPEATVEGEYEVTLTIKTEYTKNYEWALNGDVREDRTPWDRIDGHVMTVCFAIIKQNYEITVTIESWTYGGEAKTPTWTDISAVKSDGTSMTDEELGEVYSALSEESNKYLWQYSIRGSGNWSTVVPTEADQYEVRIWVDETANFNEAYGYAEFEISPATIGTENISGFVEEYNGSGYSVRDNAVLDPTLVNPEDNEPTWKFSLDPSEGFSDDILLIDVPLNGTHTYTVYYTVEAPNHTPIEAEAGKFFTVTIDPITLDVNIGSGSLDYDGATPTSDELWGVFGESITEQIEEKVLKDDLEGLGIKLSVPEGSTDVNEAGYTVTIEGWNDTNYFIDWQPGTLTIEPIPIDMSGFTPSITDEGMKLVYNNQEFVVGTYITGLPTEANDDAITWTFSTSSDGSYSSDLTVLEAGVYEIYYKGTADNHTEYASSSIVDGEQNLSLNVEKRPLTVTLNDIHIQFGDPLDQTTYGTPTVSGFATGSADGSTHDPTALGLGYSFSNSDEAGTSYTQWTSDAGSDFDIGVTITGNDTFSKNYTYNVYGIHEGSSVPSGSPILYVEKREITVIIQDLSSEFGAELKPLDFDLGPGYSIGAEIIDDLVSVDFEGDIQPIDVKPGGYKIIGEPTDSAANYDITFVGSGDPNRDHGIYTITSATVTIGYEGLDGVVSDDTYDGNEKKILYTITKDNVEIQGITPEITIYYKSEDGQSDVVQSILDAGTYEIHIKVEGGNYNGSTIHNVEVYKADYEEYYGITITVSDSSPEYNDNIQYPSIRFQDSDGNPVSDLHGIEWRFTAGATDVGDVCNDSKVVFEPTEQFDSRNINLPSNNGLYSVTIQPKQVEVHWETANDLTYNGMSQTVTAYYNDINGVEVVLDTTDVVETNSGEPAELKNFVAGGYTVTANFMSTDTGKGNYNLNYDLKQYDIKQRTVNIVAESVEMLYGSTVPELTWAYSDDENDLGKFVYDGGTIVEGGTDIGLIVSTFVEVTSSSPVINGGYTIDIRYDGMTLDVDNYVVNPTNGTLTINKRPISVTIENQRSQYDGSGIEPNLSQVLDVDYTIVDENPPDQSPGPRIVLAKEPGTDVKDGGYRLYIGSYDTTNYTIPPTEGRYYIYPAPITDISVTYDGEHFYGEDQRIIHSAEDFDKNATTLGDNDPTFEFRFEGETDYKSAEELTFSDAGTYTVYYRVSADNHETVNVDTPLEFTILTATNSIDYDQAKGWTYKGQPSTIDEGDPVFGDIQFTIYVGDYTNGKDTTGADTKDSFSSTTDAGTYTIRLYVPADVSEKNSSLNNYNEVDVRYTVTIDPLPVDVDWEHDSFVNDGLNKTNTITIDGTYMRFGTSADTGHEHSVEPRTEIVGDTMTMDYPNTGMFYVWIELRSNNYCWDTDKITNPDEKIDGDWYMAVWYITIGTNGWVEGKTLQDSGFSGWTYDGEYHEPKGVEAIHGKVYFMYSTQKDDGYSRDPFTDANIGDQKYYVIAVVDATESYEGLRSEPMEYTISQSPVDKVTLTDKTVFTYNGKPHTVKIDSYVDVDKGLIVISGDSATDADEYKVNVRLADERNYVWAGTGSSGPYDLDWEIEKATVGLPDYGGDHDDEGGFLTYNTEEQEYPFVYVTGTEDKIDVTGNTGAVVQTYWANFKLKDSDNYEWDGYEGDVYPLEWRIEPWELPIPQLDGSDTELGADGSTVYVTVYSPYGTYISVTGFDSAHMSAAAASENVSISVIEKEGNDEVRLSANRVSTHMDDGLYWIHLDLASDNFIWSDGTKSQKTLYWKVIPIEVELTSGTNEFPFDGGVHEYTPEGYDPNTMFINGNRASQVSPSGEDYEARVTLRDTVNYVWADSMDEYLQDNMAYMPWRITAAPFDLSDLEPITQFVYDGETHLPEFNDLPNWLHIQGYTTVEGDETDGLRDFGTMTVRVTFTVDENSNYRLDASYLDIPIVVSKRIVTISAEDGEMIYDGTVPTDIGWKYDSELHLVSGDYSYIKVTTDYEDGDSVGTYHTTVDIEWTDDAVANNYELIINEGYFRVNPIVVPEPEKDWVEYTGGEVTHPFDRSEKVYTVSEEGSKGIAIGNYTVTLSLNDKTNYVWWDNSNADKKLTWRIVAGDTLSKDFFQVDDSDVIYSGEQVKKSVVSLNPNIRLNEDYVVEYSGDRVNVGQVVLTIRGINDFAGSEPLEYDFEILQRPVFIPESVTKEYDKDGNTVVSGYQSNEFYTVEGTLEAKEVGDYQVTFTLTSGNYVWSDGTDGPKTVTWHIVSEKTLLEEFFVVDTSDETYTGQPFADRVVCVNKDLVEGEDYWIVYSNNTEASTEGNPATITIYGKEDYAESELVYTFTIHKAQPVLHFVYDSFRGFEDDGTLTFRPYVSGITYEDLDWTSSDPSVAYVDPESGTVSVRGVGQATVTATFPGDDNREAVTGSFDLNVGEKQTEVVIMPGDTIYVPTVITKEVDGGISDLTWLLILACAVVVMLVLVWLLWNRRTEGDGA